MFSGDSKPAPKKKVAAPVIEITLPPPPTPPPPPPPPPKEEPPPQEEEEEMIEQDEVVEEAPPEPDAPPDEPAPLGTGIVGDGPPDGFGLSGKGNGGGGNGSGGRMGRKSGRFDRSAVMIQNTLAGELRRNSKTRSATFNGKIAVWVDGTGRITRVKLDGTAGSSAADDAIRNDLVGVQLPESLPSDMPMPIHMRLTGRKAN